MKQDIGEPPWSYNHLVELKEGEYPAYLTKFFKMKTGYNLNLETPKTFNEKIQWLKLYDATDLKKKLTDKVLVRDWIKEKIGAEYLKPVIQVYNNFDEINFDKLPNKFIIKANNGCKWHYKIKDKNKFLENANLYNYIKSRFNDWKELQFSICGGFELQYKNIAPKILIEELLTNDNDEALTEYEVYCFNSKPRFYEEIIFEEPVSATVYNEDYSISDITFNPYYIKSDKKAQKSLKEAVELSKILAKDFKLVRVDWIVCKNKLYFNEMTFTPWSGFYKFENESVNLQLGELLQLQ